MYTNNSNRPTIAIRITTVTNIFFENLLDPNSVREREIGDVLNIFYHQEKNLLAELVHEV